MFKKLNNMKPILFVMAIFAFVLIYFTQASLPTKAKDTVNVFLNNNKIEFSEYMGNPTIKDGRTLIPVRIVSEKMGFEVSWNADTKEVTVSKDSKSIKLQIDSSTAVVNGKNVELDVPAQLIGSRTYVPLRFISENMGAKVEWNGNPNGGGDVYITLDGVVKLPVEEGKPLNEALKNLPDWTNELGSNSKVYYKDSFPFALADGQPNIEAINFHDKEKTSIYLTLEKQGRIPQVVFLKNNEIIGTAGITFDRAINNKQVYVYSSDTIPNFIKEADSIGFYIVNQGKLVVIPKTEFPVKPLPFK